MIEEIEDYVYTVDKELKYAVDEHMCTDFCPCLSGWNYDSYGSTLARAFETYETNDYNFSGEHTVFTDCYAERKNIWLQMAPGRKSIDVEVINLMKQFEEDFSCSGMCEHATFWASKSIELGPPKQACIYRLKDSFDEDMVLLGWSIVATGIMTLLVFCCHCGLYIKKEVVLRKSATKRKFIFD